MHFFTTSINDAWVNMTTAVKAKATAIFETLTVGSIKEYETTYGWRTLIKFIDPDGNILIWRASGKQPEWVQRDTQVNLKATVKEHKDYGGIRETIINRAKHVTT